MMTIGDKIRSVRTLKEFSQENMAQMLGISILAYGDIERGKTDIKMSRLEQIAEKLGVTTNEILKFGDTVSNFFEQCNQTNVIAGQNGNQINYNDGKDIRHQLEKADLQLKNYELQIENLSLKLRQVTQELTTYKAKFGDI